MDKVKKILYTIVLPLIILGGIVWKVIASIAGMKSKIASLETDKEFKEKEDAIKEAKNTSNSATTDYTEWRDKYLRGRNGK